MRSQGLSNAADLQTAFIAVIVSKLIYASSARIGIVTAADRLQIGLGLNGIL